MKKILQIIGLCLCLSLTVVTTTSAFTTETYCTGDDETASPQSGSIAELGESVVDTLDSSNEILTRLAKAIFIVVTAVAFIILMVSRDKQKTSLTISMIITAVVGFLGFMIVQSGWGVTLIENISSKYFS